MRLPRFMLEHTVTAEPLVGEGAGGPTYDDPVDVPCWFDGKRGSARTADGASVATSGSVLADRDHLEVLNVGARITTSTGHVTYVVAVEDHDPGGLPLPGHIVAAVS